MGTWMVSTVTASLSDTMITSGSRPEVTRRIEEGYPNDHGVVIVIDDDSGRVVDLDYWDALASSRQSRSPGRPKMGVQAREVTLLPEHWEWLAAQPKGASATLRRLVDEAQRQCHGMEQAKENAAYWFMHAMCGNREGYEEALRALYQGDEQRFFAIIADWPRDIKGYLGRLMHVKGSSVSAATVPNGNHVEGNL